MRVCECVCVCTCECVVSGHVCVHVVRTVMLNARTGVRCVHQVRAACLCLLLTFCC